MLIAAGADLKAAASGKTASDIAKLHGHKAIAALIDSGALTSTSTRAPLHLAFPAKLAGRWMPGSEQLAAVNGLPHRTKN